MIEFAAGIMLGGSIGAVIMGALVAQVRAPETRDLDPSVMRAVAARPYRRSRGIASRPAKNRFVAVSTPLATTFGTGAAAGTPHRGRLH